eukprot:scaffold1068_cov167-Amphora_coffeaeformis.AAC.24
MKVLVFTRLLLAKTAAFSSLPLSRDSLVFVSSRPGLAVNPFRRGTARSADTPQQQDKVYMKKKERPLERNEGVDLDSLTFFETVMFSMFRGMSVPFPALRRVMLYPSRKNKILAIGLSMREGLVALLIYLAAGVLAYHRVVEQWSIVDALYFTCVCFSTVGFGDLCPTNAASRLFTTLFGLGGIAFLGAAIASIGSSVVQAERDAMAAARKRSRDSLLKLFQPEKVKSVRQQSKEEQKDKIRKIDEEPAVSTKSTWGRRIRGVVMVSLPSLSLILSGGLAMRYLEGRSWSFLETLYFSLMTASTIGLGDFAPRTVAGRLFAVLYIPLAVASAGEIFSSVAVAFIQRRQKKIFEDELSTNLSLAHMNAIDSNGDGLITREEYVSFMLLEMGRLDPRELRELHRQFEHLDVMETGEIDRDDLKLIAQLRGRKIVE